MTTTLKNNITKKIMGEYQAKRPFSIELEVIGQPALEAFPDASLYESVTFSSELVKQRLGGNIQRLFDNGVLVSAELVPPLLSRVALTFHLEDYGAVVAIGVVMMRCEESKIARGVPRLVGPGFLLLFEAISLEARRAIAAFLKLKKSN